MVVRCTGAIVCLCAAMSCGGSEGAPEEEPLNGTLVDGPVSGVFYSTDTLSGITDEDGRFEYFDGETVRFFLGGTTLGQSPGQARVSPFDLAGVTPPVDDDSFNSVEGSGELFRSVNIAFLLQTLDLDGTPDNGIVISAEVAALFEGVEVDLDRDPKRFRDDHDFRRVLNEANAQSFFSTHRTIADLVGVMEHLYGTLGLELALTRVASQSLDSDADEMPDAIFTFEFDESGRPVAQRGDEDADGTPDRFFEVGYDARGLLVGIRIEDDGDGVLDLDATVSYDLDLNPFHTETDVDGDGTVDEIREIEHNEFGESLVQRADLDADGSPDEIATLQYDERGNLLLTATDDNADGVDDSLLSQQYDSQDRLVRAEEDDDANGVSERTRVFGYDDDGNEVRTAVDANADGIFDFITTRTFDGEGNLTRLEQDNTGDGMPNRIETREIDANGKLIMVEVDSDGNGTVDSRETNTYDPTPTAQSMLSLVKLSSMQWATCSAGSSTRAPMASSTASSP